MKAALMSLAVALLVVGPAMGSITLNAPAGVHLSFAPEDDSAAPNGPGAFATGFEPTEAPPYVLGPIEPQNGWTASGVNLPFASVSAANPFLSTQHLRVIKDTTVAAGTQRVVLGPDVGNFVGGTSNTDMQVALSNDQGGDFDVVGQTPSQGFLTWRVKFHFNDGTANSGPGHIFVLDDLGAGLVFVDTGVVWNEGPYKELQVLTNAGTDQIAYFYGGNQIYQGVAGIFAGSSVEQIVFVSDNFQLATETDDVDAITLTPEPGSLVLLGMGAIALIRRRR